MIGDAGVVHHNVETSKLVCCALQKGLPLVLLDHVDLFETANEVL